MTEKEERKWSKNTFLVPKEEKINNNPFDLHTAFRTTDKEVYVRNGNSGVIRKVQQKVKGKANKKTAKMQRIWDRTFKVKENE